jgi:predicted Holliday junction resolvase-like endonuclease
MEFIEIIGISVLVLIMLYTGYRLGKFVSKKQMEEKIPDIREDAIKQSRAVLSGQFSEQIAPYFPDFPYKPTEARFLGKPIDFIVFKGMDERNVDEIVFVEVKSGKSALNGIQKSLKSSIENKKISWHEYRIPDKD